MPGSTSSRDLAESAFLNLGSSVWVIVKYSTKVLVQIGLSGR